MVLQMSPHEQPFLHTNTTVHGGKETQAFRDEHLLAQHVGVKILGCAMASYVPISLCFPSCHPRALTAYFPAPPLPAATSSYSPGTVHLGLLPHVCAVHQSLQQFFK